MLTTSNLILILRYKPVKGSDNRISGLTLTCQCNSDLCSLGMNLTLFEVHDFILMKYIIVTDLELFSGKGVHNPS